MKDFDFTLPRHISREMYYEERHRRLPPAELRPDGLYVCCVQLRQTRLCPKEFFTAYPARVFNVSGLIVHFAMLNMAYDTYTQVYKEPFPDGLWEHSNPSGELLVLEGYIADMTLFDGLDTLLSSASVNI